MERFVIKGGVALNGEVEIGGAKKCCIRITCCSNNDR